MDEKKNWGRVIRGELYEQFKFCIADLAILHFLNQGIHHLQRILLKMVSVYCLFLVDIHQIILVDLTHQC